MIETLLTQFNMKMKSILVVGSLFMASVAMAQEYKIITTVESIVPAGIGRSRLTEPKEPADYKALTTSRIKGTKSDMGDVKRDDVKIDAFDETKLLNFFSIAGINFQNIASNDAVVSSKLTDMAREGWTLVFVTSGVESDGGKDDGNGIFITRYVFKR